MVPALLGAAVAMLALLGVIGFLVFKGDGGGGVAGPGKTPPGGGGGSGANSAIRSPTLTIEGPAFADVRLSGNVVYLIDRSQANEDVLDMLKGATYYSAQSLGPGQKFQILFWHHPSDGIVSYPEEGWAPATRDEAQRAGEVLDPVIGWGNTDLAQTLERAVAARPDEIVIATAKGLNLEDDTLAAAEEILRGTAIKVHTFALGETESSVLKQLAHRTGGSYRELTYTQLKNLLYVLPER